MKVLLNMNLPRRLRTQLVEAGHECRHVGDIGMASATDLAIIAEARLSHEVILTHDLDYGHLLAFSGGTAPSVVIFRMRHAHPERLFQRFASVLAQVEGPLKEGAVVVLEDSAFRVRQLPIAARRD